MVKNVVPSRIATTHSDQMPAPPETEPTPPLGGLRLAAREPYRHRNSCESGETRIFL